MSLARLRLATRGSALALAQAWTARASIEAVHPELEVELIVLRTSGDVSAAPLAAMGGVGVFVKELERALVAGEADLAIHSLKDLPTVLSAGLTIAAVLEREDARDALVARAGGGLDQLPPGAMVATGSPRRRALLRAVRPDLAFVDIRGNVDTRIEKLRRGDADALVLAVAGLRRLGRGDEVSEALPLDRFPCAPGQGALALEAIAGSAAARLAAALDHRPTRRAVEAERAFLLAVGGGCSVPVGAFAVERAGGLEMVAAIADPDTGEVVRDRLEGEREPWIAGRRLAHRLLAAGGRSLLGAAACPLAGRRILVVRRAAAPGDFEDRLIAAGSHVSRVDAIATEPLVDTRALDAAVREIRSFAVVAITSARGAEALADALDRAGDAKALMPLLAAVGSATARALRARGLEPGILAERGTGADLAAMIIAARGRRKGRVLLARAEVATRDLPDMLVEAGFEVSERAAYRTVMAPGLAAELAPLLDAPPMDAIVLSSPSAVTALVASVPDGVRSPWFQRTAVACLGPTTAAAARAAGLTVSVVLERPEPDFLVGALARHFSETTSTGERE